MIYRIDKAKVKGKYKNKEQATNNDTERITLTKNRYRVRSNFRMTKFTKTIHWPVLRKDIFEIGGNHFKRYITCMNYELLFSKMLCFCNFCN